MPTCRTIAPLLIAEPDGELLPAEVARVAEHVASCEACRRQRAVLAAVPGLLREATAALSTPDPDRAWRGVRQRIQESAAGRRSEPRRPRTFAWGVQLAAATALAFAALFVFRPAKPPASAMVAQAEFVQSEGAGSTLVYLDQESGWLIVWAETAPAEGTI